MIDVMQKETRQVMYVQSNTKARSRNHRFRGKARNITYYECAFVAAVIQPAKRMRRFIFPSWACLTPPHFSTLSHKRNHFRKTIIEHKLCFDFLQNCYLKHF